MSGFVGTHYIDGAWVDEAPNGWTESINPASGTPLGRSASGSAELATRAVMAARRAFEDGDWQSDPRLRARVLAAFADRLEARANEIARLMARENGKVLAQAKHEVAAGFGEARYYAGLARNVFGRTFESAPGAMSLLTREPAGVVSVIVPWNAPVTLLVRSVAPALAAGCTVVMKPAPQTPLVHARIMECFDEVTELPRGVVNSVNEHGTEVGEVLSSHPQVDVVSFTGSSRTGRTIMTNAAHTVKHVSLELGGKAPAVIFADADLDNAIAEIRRGVITLNGQMCTSVSRVLVDRAILAEVRSRLKSALEDVRLGDPMDSETEMGPLIDRDSQERILGIAARAEEDAEIILRGGAPGGRLAAGCFVSPTLFAIEDVTHPLVQQELFGPVVSLEAFSDEAEAVAKANATRFGLAASVYTRDLNRAMRLGRKLKFGTVWLNCHNRLLAEAETGGFRESGIGRLHGVEALNDFLETKHIYYEAGT